MISILFRWYLLFAVTIRMMHHVSDFPWFNPSCMIIVVLLLHTSAVLLFPSKFWQVIALQFDFCLCRLLLCCLERRSHSDLAVLRGPLLCGLSDSQDELQEGWVNLALWHRSACRSLRLLRQSNPSKMKKSSIIKKSLNFAQQILYVQYLFNWDIL